VIGDFLGICASKSPPGDRDSTGWTLRASGLAARALAAGAATALVLAAAALAAPPPPSGLEVRGGEDAWHPDRAFRLRWVNPAPPGGSPVAAVHYLVRDPLGSVVVPARRLGWAASELDLLVPAIPAAYLAEVWLEDAAGEQGARAEARLRFDGARPAAVEPRIAGGWIGHTAFPLAVRLEHPAGEPLSGIRGYAVAIDSAPGREPCAAADRCTEAETDLSGGAENDSFAIAGLPEGASHLSAAAVSGSGMRSTATGRTVLRVDKTPPTTHLAGAPAAWANEPVSLVATATDSRSGMQPEGDAPPPFTAIRIDDGAPVAAAGASASAQLIGEGVHSVAFYARDLAGNVNDGGATNGMPNPLPSRAQVRIDRTPPSAAFLNAQDPQDPELIRAWVADPLSGPDPARGWIGVRRSDSGDPYLPLPAAPSAPGELRARWDSDAYPPGQYEFEATAYDRAGNATTTRRKADGEEMVLRNPLKTPTAVVAALGNRPRVQRVIRYGRGMALGGRLTGGHGQPLAHAPLRIVERFDGGFPEQRESTVWTGADGGFGLRLPAGPNREVVAVFDGSRTLSRTSSSPLRLAVRSGVRLRASAALAQIGGPPLVFRGTVAAAPGAIPPAGKSVELQFRLPGLAWTEFRTVQTDRRGRFRYAYRFSDDDSRGVRFQFRAYAPAQDGWPYEPAGSLPIVVRGR
jgi:hypothetical protein